MTKLVDVADLKSAAPQGAWRFESSPGHFLPAPGGLRSDEPPVLVGQFPLIPEEVPARKVEGLLTAGGCPVEPVAAGVSTCRADARHCPPARRPVNGTRGPAHPRRRRPQGRLLAVDGRFCYFWAAEPLNSSSSRDFVALSLPLSVPFTDDVVMANVNTAWAVASDIWSSASMLMLSKVSHARW